MITNFLLDHAALVPLGLVLTAVACVGLGYATRHSRRVQLALTAVSLLGVLALTLVPAATAGRVDPGCTVQFSLPRLGSVELLANVALLVPAACFAALASRRPLVVLAAGSGLSAAIEGLQALAPGIGRACDTNDWAMNTLGVLVGVLLAVGTARLAGRGSRARPS